MGYLDSGHAGRGTHGHERPALRISHLRFGGRLLRATRRLRSRDDRAPASRVLVPGATLNRVERGGWAMVVGDPGIGKTRLLAEAARQWPEAGMQVVSGGLLPLLQKLPLPPGIDALGT